MTFVWKKEKNASKAEEEQSKARTDESGKVDS